MKIMLVLLYIAFVKLFHHRLSLTVVNQFADHATLRYTTSGTILGLGPIDRPFKAIIRHLRVTLVTKSCLLLSRVPSLFGQVCLECSRSTLSSVAKLRTFRFFEVK
jgi:hypothetical protein